MPISTMSRTVADNLRLAGSNPRPTALQTAGTVAVGGGVGNCQGQVTITFTWSGPEGTEPEGTLIAVKSLAQASAVMGNVASSNGLSDPTDAWSVLLIPPAIYQFNSMTGWQSDRTTHRTKWINDKVGHTFTVTLTPTASSTTGPGGSVSVQATIYPITLTFTGPVGTDRLLAVGQRFKAEVTGVGTGTETYTWSTPSAGDPFEDYLTSSYASTYFPFEMPATSDKTLECHFAKLATPSISCTYYSALAGKSVTVSKTISVLGPNRSEQTHSIGLMQLLHGSPPNWNVWNSGSPYPSGYLLWGGVYEHPTLGAQTWGVWQVDILTEPEFISGSGEWGYVQIRNRTSTLNGNTTYGTGLDTAFPYTCPIAGGAWTSTGSSNRRVFSDAPGHSPLSPFPLTFSFDGNYDLYIFYKPVDSPAGSSVRIPIRKFPWASKGECASSTSSGSWSQQDNGSGWKSGALDYPSFPDW